MNKTKEAEQENAQQHNNNDNDNIQLSESQSFYKFPKQLFNTPYNKLSNDAKILYMLLWDRHALSDSNRWRDKDGRIFIYFSRDEAMEMINVSHGSIGKIFKELKDLELIDEIRQGIKRPNIIYLKGLENTLNSKNLISRTQKIGVQELKKFDANKTYNNKTYNNNNNNNNITPEVTKLHSDIVHNIGSVDMKTLCKLIEQKGIDKVKEYAEWGEYKNKINPTGFFINAVKEDWELKKVDNERHARKNGHIPQMGNFDQRIHSDEYYNSLYDNECGVCLHNSDD